MNYEVSNHVANPSALHHKWLPCHLFIQYHIETQKRGIQVSQSPVESPIAGVANLWHVCPK